jgi:hypothetical protein
VIGGGRALLVIALALAACGGSSSSPRTPPATPDPEPGPAVTDEVAAEVADAFVEVLATMVAISREPACPQMGAGLSALFDRSQELFEQSAALAADPEAAKLLVAAMDARAAEVAPLIEAMGPGLVRCREDASVVEAMGRMPTMEL